MNKNYYIIFLCVFGATFAHATQAPKDFDKSDFYLAMSSESADKIESQLAALRSSSLKVKEPYEGALLMKKAGLTGNPKNKLNLFKSGRRELEDALTTDSLNAEFHFLRLMIQEHSPKILRYKKDFEQDRGIIVRSFKSLSPVVQHAIRDYSNTSRVLKPGSF